MTIRVRLPDGSYVNVQSDDPQAAAAAARKHWESNPGKPKTFLDKVKGAFDTASDLNDTFVDSLLPNWGDEIRGTGRAIRALASGKPMGPAFREGQRSQQADQQRLGRDHPNLKLAAQATGTVAGGALPAGRALKGASLAQKASQGARVGAAYGLASGLGQGEGFDPARRVTNGAVSAVAGGTVGALIPVATRAAQVGGRWARATVPGVDTAYRAVAGAPRALANRLPPSVRNRIALRQNEAAPAPSAAVAQANRQMLAAMNEGRIANGLPHQGPAATPQSVAAEVERRNQMGVPAQIGDVTEPLRDRSGWASRGVGPGQNMVRDSLLRRQQGAAQRVRQHVQETMPTTPDPIAFTAQRTQAAKDAARPLYDEAYAQPMVHTPELTGIGETPAFRQALPQAYENIQNQIDPVTGRPLDPSAMGFRWFPDGTAAPRGAAPLTGGGHVTAARGLSTEGYDQVARAMTANGRAAGEHNALTGAVRDTTNSVHINNRARDLRRAIGDQNEPYRQAVEGFGDDMTHVNAFGQGQDITKLTGHEINAQRQALPDMAHETWSTGAGTKLADDAASWGAKNPNGNVSRQVTNAMGDEIKQDAIGQMGGNNGGVRNLLDRMEGENQAHMNFAEAYGNSATARRMRVDQDMDGNVGIPTSSSGLISTFVNHITSNAAPRYQAAIKARVAEIVTASDARSVQDVVQALEQQATRDRGFADLMHTAGIATGATYGANVQATDPTPDP